MAPLRPVGDIDPPVSDRVGQVEGSAVDGERDVPEYAQVEPGGGDNNVGPQLVSGFQRQYPFSVNVATSSVTKETFPEAILS